MPALTADQALAQIDLQDQRLMELEAVCMAKIIAKRNQYIKQGRHEAAHGAATAVWIMWLTLTSGREFITDWDKL